MPTREELLTAVEGKAVERGLEQERKGGYGIEPTREDGYVILRYRGPVDARVDNLHKQSIRSLVERMAPDWKIHIASVDNGFSVEVRPKPGADVPQVKENPKPEPTDEKLDQVTSMLEELLKNLRASA